MYVGDGFFFKKKIGMADCLRNELAYHGIGVHVYYPPNMDTPGFEIEVRYIDFCLMKHDFTYPFSYMKERKGLDFYVYRERERSHLSHSLFFSLIRNDINLK